MPPTEPSSGVRCVPASYEDIDALMELQFTASAADEFHQAIWGADTPGNRHAAGQRLLQKWQTDGAEFYVVKCLDRGTGALMAFCAWEMVPAKATREAALEEDCMNRCDWLAGQERKVARAYLIDGLEEEWNVLQGAPHAHLTNLCTHPDARRRGAATALVQWGLDAANARGIPAYCEVSDMSFQLYLRMGFKQVSTIHSMLDGQPFSTCPVVLKDPDGSYTSSSS